MLHGERRTIQSVVTSEKNMCSKRLDEDIIQERMEF